MSALVDLTNDPEGEALEQDVIELSVVMPCLNEEESVAPCVRAALEGIAKSGLRGEVIVCDNGSTDRSVERAEAAGARVVHQPHKGYGNAYLKGFAASRGQIVVMGDSDMTYDFTELDKLVEPLVADEADYCLGSRFGGEILPGAMTFSHRYIGNPVLTAILNRFFGLRSSDAHSGMRAFTRDAVERMGLRCEGMEFASEIVIKAAVAGLRVTERPIQYHPRVGETKLRTFRDGWRHLRFMLLLAPNWMFVYPGVLLFGLGMVGQIGLLGGDFNIGSHHLDVHFSVLFALLSVLGFQSGIFGMFAHGYADVLGMPAKGKVARWVEEDFTLERGLFVGVLFFVGGLGVDIWVLIDWLRHNMGELNAIRQALMAMTFMILGVNLVFASFFLGLLKVRVRTRPAV
jgi:glycosyltransferase involved in cell wall biosynthesis